LGPHRQQQKQQSFGDDADEIVLDPADNPTSSSCHSGRGDPGVFRAEEHELGVWSAGEHTPGEPDAVRPGDSRVGQNDLSRPFSQSDHGLGLAHRRPDDAGHA
jgi:hypothetical protein